MSSVQTVSVHTCTKWIGLHDLNKNTQQCSFTNDISCQKNKNRKHSALGWTFNYHMFLWWWCLSAEYYRNSNSLYCSKYTSSIRPIQPATCQINRQKCRSKVQLVERIIQLNCFQQSSTTCFWVVRHVSKNWTCSTSFNLSHRRKFMSHCWQKPPQWSGNNVEATFNMSKEYFHLTFMYCSCDRCFTEELYSTVYELQGAPVQMILLGKFIFISIIVLDFVPKFTLLQRSIQDIYAANFVTIVVFI